MGEWVACLHQIKGEFIRVLLFLNLRTDTLSHHRASHAFRSKTPSRTSAVECSVRTRRKEAGSKTKDHV